MATLQTEFTAFKQRCETAEGQVHKAQALVATLEQEIKDINERQDALERKKNEEYIKIAALLAYGFYTSHKDINPASRRDALNQLKRVLPKIPYSRRVGILVGRLHAFFGEYKEAIEVLNGVMRQRDELKYTPDEDYAALLYNCACYLNLRANKATTPEELTMVAGWREESWTKLKLSVSFDEENYDQATKESDFDSLWDAARTTAILKEFAETGRSRPSGT